MRTHSYSRAFTAFAVILVSLFSFVSSAAAKGYATVGTTLTIDPPVAVSVGTPTHVVVHLISSKGEPVVNQRVELFIDGVRERSAKTDRTGTASIRVKRDTAGAYPLFVAFKGSKLPSLGSSKATGELIINPALVEIHTTPSLPDIKFSLDGRIFTSDDYGVARIEVKKAGKYHLEVLPLEVKDADIQMDFGRWGDEIFQPERDIEIPLNKPLDIGFEVSYRVSQTFVDLSNRPVDDARVTSITMKGSNGTTYTFEDHDPHWLPAGRVIRLNNGLEQTKILYSVISVEIDGSNVVSQAQQRYFVNPNDVWTVKLLLYKATFNARDALFGFPIGTGIRMEYPDGEIQSYTFDTDKAYTLDGLARGIYRVTVTGAQGYAPPTPIALSRDQAVELMVFSNLDIGVLVSVGLMLSIGLLLFGRPYILTQTIALAHRMIPKRRGVQPAMHAQTSAHAKWIALRSRLFPKKEIAGSREKQLVQFDENVLQAEAPVNVQEQAIEVTGNLEQQAQSLQKSRVESSV